MLTSSKLIAAVLISGLVFSTVSCQKKAVEKSAHMSMGSVEDVTYAEKLWKVMRTERFVGENEEKLEPFFGGARPHGMILEVAYRNITVGDHTGFVVVKKNYNGPDVSMKNVKMNRSKYLSSITVMYQREQGYDEDNQNWFWVKYKPDGSLFKKKMKGKSVAMAGRILKGKNRDESGGCLYCHSSAGGGDYIFYPEIKLPSSGS